LREKKSVIKKFILTVNWSLSWSSPSYAKSILIHYPLFSLAKKAQRKKLSKKESAEEIISPSADGDKGYAPLTAPPFWKRRAKIFER
jgi:hypothetical protein